MLGGCDGDRYDFLGDCGGEFPDCGFWSQQDSAVRGVRRLSSGWAVARHAASNAPNRAQQSAHTPFIPDESLVDELNPAPLRRGKKPTTNRVGPLRHFFLPLLTLQRRPITSRADTLASQLISGRPMLTRHDVFPTGFFATPLMMWMPPPPPERFGGGHGHDSFCMLRSFNVAKRRGRSSTETPILGAYAARYGVGFKEDPPTRKSKDIVFVRASTQSQCVQPTSMAPPSVTASGVVPQSG